MLGGKVRVAEWKDGEEPILQVDKRGRFITNMGFANFVTAAVESDDPRIKGTCMVILEETDPGIFDRGTPTRKLVHQLSSTNDPVFSLKVPASRIIGGYTVKDGVIVPRYSHGEIIEAVFRRTRVTVAIMTSAKLLSAIEPVIRYARGRFRGGSIASPVRRATNWACNSSRTWCTAWWTSGPRAKPAPRWGSKRRACSTSWTPWRSRRPKSWRRAASAAARPAFKAMRKVQKDAIEFLAGQAARAEGRHAGAVRAARLAWPTCCAPPASCGTRATARSMMREAVSLMGGYGITEDCPGFLGHKWMDAQLEATYEGPEAVQRRQLSVTMTDDLFLAQFRQWIREMRLIANDRPGTGACALATAMQMWLWTLEHLLKATDADGAKLYQSSRQGVTFPLADALCWLLPSRGQILDVLELEKKGPENPTVAEGLPGLLQFMTDLCHVQAARAAGEVGRSAPSWCSATTATPRGIRKAAPPATRRTTWKPWKA